MSYSLQKLTFHHGCQMDSHRYNMISECLVVMATSGIYITKFPSDREASGTKQLSLIISLSLETVSFVSSKLRIGPRIKTALVFKEASVDGSFC